MFDAGLFEMLVIFTLGLLVLGPERLPKVARVIGRWIGQARRAVTRLNNDIERELALEEIRRFQRESEEKIRESERKLRESEQQVRREVTGTLPADEAPAPDMTAGDAAAAGASREGGARAPAQADPEHPSAGRGEDLSSRRTSADPTSPPIQERDAAEP